MAQLSPGRAIVAGLLVGTGAALASTGIMKPGEISLGPPSVSLVLAPTLGVIALILGFALFARAFRPSDTSAPLVPAHIAFASKPNPTIDLPAVERPMPAAKRTTSAPPLGQSAPRAQSDDADDQIRELTRKINRAGVMLATGKLSGEGYAKYVEDLKRQRGVLEAARMHRDLHPKG